MKKLIIIAVAIAAMGVVRADVLYWMVGDEYLNDAKAQGDNTAATLYAVYNGVQQSPALDSVTGNLVAEYAGVSGFDVDLGSSKGDGWSYFVELWNGRQTSPITYQSALANGYIITPGMSTPTAAGLAGFGSGTTSYNVPEPTSGLLFLVGGMLLGLKRRRQQV